MTTVTMTTRATVESAGPASAASGQPFRRPLMIANSTEIGGGNTSLLALVQGMRELGLDPAIVHPEPGPMSRRCEQLGIPQAFQPLLQPGWKQPLATWRSMRAWQRIFREHGADLVHANEPFTARTVTLAARRARLPLACHVHLDVEPAAARWIFRRLPAPQLFLFSSHQLLDDNWPHFRETSPAALALATWNGINVERFSPRPQSQRLPSQQQPGSTRPRIGIVANLIPIKGHRDFLAMAAALQQEGVDAEYRILGANVHGTDYDRELQQLARELGVSDAVQFCGYCDDVPAAVNQLDLVVCASHQESFGLCLAEAMACEKPVVATRVGGIPEVVEDGVTGLIVPPHQPAALAAAVRRLLDDPQQAGEMGKRGRQRVCEQFTHAAYVERVLDAYRQMATRRSEVVSPA